MTLLKILSRGNFITYSKPIARKIGLEAAILLGELCSIADMNNYKEFFCQSDRIQNDTCLTDYSVRQATKKLINCGIITVTKKGIPCKNYFTLNEDVLIDILDNDDFQQASTEEINEQQQQNQQSTLLKSTNFNVEITEQVISKSTNSNVEFDTTVKNINKNQDKESNLKNIYTDDEKTTDDEVSENPQQLFLRLWRTSKNSKGMCIFQPLAKIINTKDWAEYWNTSPPTNEQIETAMRNFVDGINSGLIETRFIPSSPDRFVLNGSINRYQSPIAPKRNDNQNKGAPPPERQSLI